MTTCAVEYVQRRLIIPLATWPSARFVYEDNKGAASPVMTFCLFKSQMEVYMHWCLVSHLGTLFSSMSSLDRVIQFSSMNSCLFMRFLAFLLLKRSFFIRLFC
ncbi:hypothetical protein SETIT_4G070300v2 [Setaria italica]|uniref:Uncharacterized protein n=1 Tax=Setaria italica TaxID=4555 RepID=A0A368QRM6_SETIT|nr:hypothetical protein SETIT_4G070300v2 [Setaria italica]